MVIDLQWPGKLEQGLFAQYKRVSKAWGVEYWIVNTGEYCGKALVVNAGWQCSLHYHAKKHETFWVITGGGWVEHRMQVPSSGRWFLGREEVGVHSVLTIERGEPHRFGTECGMTLVEFSTHHEDEDSYRIEPSGRTEDQNATR